MKKGKESQTGKIFITCTIDKELISIISKQVLHINKKQINNQEKNGKRSRENQKKQ